MLESRASESSETGGSNDAGINRRKYTYQVTIAYDGSAYCGFQLQKSVDTVQARLEVV